MLNKHTAIIIKWLEVKATDDDKTELLKWLKAHPVKGILDDEIIRLCKLGSALDAVKYTKDQLGIGLKEAKDYVDGIRANIAYDGAVGMSAMAQPAVATKYPHIMLNPTKTVLDDGLNQLSQTSQVRPADDLLELLKIKFGK